MGMPGRWIATGLAGAFALALAGIVAAQSGADTDTDSPTNVEVRVWQSVSDAGSLYVSARATGGSWRDLGTVPLDMSGQSASGRYRYGDISLDVPRAGSDGTVTVQVRVWQGVGDAAALYVSARWAGGSWRDLSTVPLTLDGLSASGRYRYGDSTLISPEYLPTILFHGMIPEAKQVKIREKILNTMMFYLNRYGIIVPDITFHIGENDLALRSISEKIVGEPQIISCGLYAAGGFIFILVACENLAIEHEYFHAIQDHLSEHHNWGPLWLTEGSAEYASLLYRDSIGQEKYEDAIALGIWQLGLNRIIMLQDVEDAVVWFDDVRAMATLAVDWLVRQAGVDAPIDYYRMLSRGIPWEEAFRRVFGMPMDDVYPEFENYRRDTFPVLHHVRGTVLGHDGNPIRDWNLRIDAFPFPYGAETLTMGESASTIVSEDGTFDLRVIDGIYSLDTYADCKGNRIHLGWHSGGNGVTREYDLLSPLVVEEDIDNVSVKIPKSLSSFSDHCIIGEYRSISGVVYHSNGSPLPGIMITALDADYFVRDTSVTNQHGDLSGWKI